MLSYSAEHAVAALQLLACMHTLQRIPCKHAVRYRLAMQHTATNKNIYMCYNMHDKEQCDSKEAIY